MKRKPETVPSQDVDRYLASVPAQERAVLEELRRTIKAAAPMAEERISYGMPAFRYHGPLVFFAAFKNHLGFYGVSRKILDTFSSELAPFRTSTTTLRFSSEHPIPAPLITRIVRARVEENEQRAAEKLRK